ncbi:hypothetical protein ACFFK0_03170, partial [Paenibacillus chartarius]
MPKRRPFLGGLRLLGRLGAEKTALLGRSSAVGALQRRKDGPSWAVSGRWGASVTERQPFLGGLGLL